MNLLTTTPLSDQLSTPPKAHTIDRGAIVSDAIPPASSDGREVAVIKENHPNSFPEPFIDSNGVAHGWAVCPWDGERIRREGVDAAAAATVREHQMKSSGLELQVALDSFFTGHSETPLAELLARESGVDPARVSLKITPLDRDAKPPQPSAFQRVQKIEGGFDGVRGVEAKWQAHHRQNENLTKTSHGGSRDARVVPAPPGPRPDSLSAKEMPALEYEYTDLDLGRRQIRLLMPTPSEEDPGHAELKLQTFDLDRAPNFYALSYV